MHCISDLEVADLTRTFTGRPQSLFTDDLAERKDELESQIQDKAVLVIGGAGTIGSSYLKQLLPFEPAKVAVVDTNENGLAELIRDLRSSSLKVPDDFTTYPMDLGNSLTLRMIHDEGPFDIVANFAALKHVRSEKNAFTTAYLVDNNVTKAEALMTTLLRQPPKHFFCVSTDKAANPVNVMGATKRLMEDLAFSAADEFKSTTARFANVAFSNGSLLDAFRHRISKRQPLSMPGDVKRYFVSWEESGQLCLLASITGQSREIFTPKLDATRDQYFFTTVAEQMLDRIGYQFEACKTEAEAREKMSLVDKEKRYPCLIFESDTTGEKSEEIFSSVDEQVDDDRYQGIRVVKSNQKYATLDEVRSVIRELNELFDQEECSKEQMITALTRYLPSFQHKETNKYLDQKCRRTTRENAKRPFKVDHWKSIN